MVDMGLVQAIATDVEQRHNALEAEQMAKAKEAGRQRRAEHMKALRAAVRKAGITPQLWTALEMRYRPADPDVDSGKVVFSLRDERGIPNSFCLQIRMNAHNDVCLNMPRLYDGVWKVSQVGRLNAGVTTIHDPISSTTWGETIAYFAAKWVREMEQNRQTLAAEAARAAENNARAEAEREARIARVAAIEAELNALRAEQEQVAAAIGEAIADLEIWPKGKTLTLYRWGWCQGAVYDDEAEENQFDYGDGLSLSDRLDDDGYVAILTRGRVRLLADVHKPVVEEIALAGMEDLQNAKIYAAITTVPVLVQGASKFEYGDGEQSFWRWGDGPGLEQRAKAPAGWLRSLLGIPDSYAITVQRPEAE